MAEPVIKVEGDELADALAGKTSEEETSAEETKSEETKAEEETKEEPSETDKLRSELESLRQITLEQKKQNAMLESRLKRLSRPKTVAKTETEEEEGEVKTTPKKEEPSQVELLEDEVKQIHDSKDSIFEMQLDVMAESKKFSDATEVCSEANIADVMDAITKQVAKSEGLDYHHASLEVEKFVWSNKNPYKYLYGLIKEYHPKYAGKAKEQDKTTDVETQNKGGTKEKSKAPGSIAKVPGSDGAASGWTAAKIDAMPESELSKVPRDIYEKYMTGELE